MQPSGTVRNAELPAGTIDHRDAVPPDAPPVVFVHGFLTHCGLRGTNSDRLAARGCRPVAPAWPQGAHATPMRDGADRSRGLARVVLPLLEEFEQDRVTLVGNDTGGAHSQFVLDKDPGRIDRLVLTREAFDRFPPYAFDLLFRAAVLEVGRSPRWDRGACRVVASRSQPGTHCARSNLTSRVAHVPNRLHD